MDDFRVSTGWVRHPKRVKLERRLGRDGVLAIMDLWGWCASTPSRRDGDLTGMDAEEVGIAAGFPGDPEDFVRALLEVGLMEGEPGAYRVHDYTDSNPHVAGQVNRHEAARTNAMVRWHKGGKHRDRPQDGCPLCATDAQKMPIDAVNDANGATASFASVGNAIGNAPTNQPTYQPTNPPVASASHPVPPKLANLNFVQTTPGVQRWGSLYGPEAQRLRKCEPITEAELLRAVAETNDRANKPGWRFLCSVLEGYRKKPPPDPPRDTSAWDAAMAEMRAEDAARAGGGR